MSIGACANPDAGQAAFGALLELVQMEISASLAAGRSYRPDDAEIGFLPPLGKVEAPHLFPAASPIPLVTKYAADTIGQHLEALVAALGGLGLRVLGLDRTPPNFAGRVSKILVPGLCSKATGLDLPRLVDVPVKLGWAQTPQRPATMLATYPL